LIAAPTVDLVSIVTPPALHCEIAVAALQAGKHVICEKPTALNLAEAEIMLAAAQAAPNQLAIIDHELRFQPPRVQLRQLVKEGYVGNVLSLIVTVQTAWRLNPAAPWSWWSDATQGGGMLGAVGSHVLDYCRWLVGKIDSLSAQLQIGHYDRPDPATGRQRIVTADDQAQILLRFANGAQGLVTVSAITPGGAGSEIFVIGTKGALRLDAKDQLWGVQGDDLHKGNWQTLQTKPLPATIPESHRGNPFALGSFYLAQVLSQALPAGQFSLPDAASFYDGLVVQRALDAARKSHSEQVWVQL
jgi:predicted dehydrogenase